jgi:hypothetical protein
LVLSAAEDGGGREEQKTGDNHPCTRCIVVLSAAMVMIRGAGESQKIKRAEV